jgi:RNA polymerase sigma-70 factor (ECF subfamily)
LLLERARQGDDLAFQRLVERYEARVAATAIGMLGPGMEAEDVGQETFIRLYRSLDRFRGDSALGTYLTRIAINVSLTSLKRRKSKGKLFVSPGRDAHASDGGFAADGPLAAPDETSGVDWTAAQAPDVHEELERRQRADIVRRAIEGLKPVHRVVMVLRMIEGYSTREAAEILEVPPGTVMSRLSRAMESLEGLLEPVMADRSGAKSVQPAEDEDES